MIVVTGLEKVGTHPDFPEKVWVIVEHPRDEPYRIVYNPKGQSFTRTRQKSLAYERGFSGVYGWIGGTGIPPKPHYDVFVLTKQQPAIGDVVLGYIIGFFHRRDGDHKFVAIDAEWKETVSEADLVCLDRSTRVELQRIYPRIEENEGWYGAKEAQAYLLANQPLHD